VKHSRVIPAAVVILTNTATGEVDQLGEDIIRMIAGIHVEPRKFEKAVTVPPETLQKYVGKYELAPGAIFTVSVDGGKLMVGLTGQPTFQVFARSETEWYYKVVEATLVFELDEKGKCDSLVLLQSGLKLPAKRIP
jgi:D-alanyl-D-alanine-carboxypeptidase/D-alanyl-D-alanine-endopeptidase